MALYTEPLSAGKTATQNAKKEIKFIQPKSITVSASSVDGVKSKEVSIKVNDNIKVSSKSESDGTQSVKLKYENNSQTVSSSI